MAKKPARNWTMVASLGIPLSIVGVSAMAISYATLIDVARVNGLPLPELFPILVDVGTVATMIAAAQFRMRGVSGLWLAYSTFILLSLVSIVANATHAWRAADMTVTNPVAAAILAATPPTALLAITHLVMMLVPDEKERAKLNAIRERSAQEQANQIVAPKPAARVTTPEAPATAAAAAAAPAIPASPPLRLVTEANEREEVRERILRYTLEESRRPTGAIVGEWLGGKSAKTGQRMLTAMEADGDFDERSVLAIDQPHSSSMHTADQLEPAMNVGGGQ